MAGLLGYLGVVLVHDACCRQSISQHEPVHKAQRPESGRKLKSSWRSEATQHNLEARGMTWPYCFSTSLLTHKWRCFSERVGGHGCLLRGATGMVTRYAMQNPTVLITQHSGLRGSRGEPLSDTTEAIGDNGMKCCSETWVDRNPSLKTRWQLRRDRNNFPLFIAERDLMCASQVAGRGGARLFS